MTNVVVLRGRVSRPAGDKILPSGDRLATLDLTIPADPGDAGARAESVPLSWFDAPAWVLEIEAGEELVAVGRVRRRFFRTGSGLQSRTEVVVDGAVPARQASRAGALVRKAADRALAGVDASRKASPTFE